MKVIVLTLLIVVGQVASVRIFLMGGAVANNQTSIYENLALATGKKPSPKNCNDDWKSTQCPKIAVITSAANSQKDGNDAYTVDEPGSLSYKSLFSLYGFTPKHISVHVDNYQKTTDLKNPQAQLNFQTLKIADIIFFNGGDQARHARSWLNDDGTPNTLMKLIYDRAMNDSVILSGTSAGSMIMCSPIYGQGITYGHIYFASKVGLALKNVSDGGVNGTGLADTRNGTKGIQFSDNGGIMPGFNVVPFLSDTHFDNRGRLGRMIPALAQLKKDIGVGVDQSTAFFYENGKGTVYGKNGVFIVDISKAIKTTKSYFSMEGIIVNYLTYGDTYIFKDKSFIAQKSKQLIKKPAYSGYIDSTDTFNSYQMTKLITRLVDQTSTTNIGRSKVPSGYNSSAPIFKLTFQNNSTKTAGYWSPTYRKYAALNVNLIITYQ